MMNLLLILRDILLVYLIGFAICLPLLDLGMRVGFDRVSKTLERYDLTYVAALIMVSVVWPLTIGAMVMNVYQKIKGGKENE